MKRLAVLAAVLLAGAGQAAPDVGGQLRAQWTERADSRDDGPTLSAELRARGAGLTAVATVQAETLEGRPWTSRGVFNELNVATTLGGWQLAAGRKIVGWDVGYGFRPNDVVQQEQRRTLLATTAEGRPLLMAEHFDADTAWSVVWVNPTHEREERGAEEPALALRAYRRIDSLDAHGFARLGARTGGSVGGAFSWVAGDSLELHGSMRLIERADTLALAVGPADIVRTNPWVATERRRTAQALVGGTWTTESQLSLLAEAWWDGAALADAQWDAWNARTLALRSLAGSPVPAEAIAGNLAWQANAFLAAQNLRRTNLFARLSWQHGPWQPALDVLVTPRDRGRIVTASLGWQGDRVRLDGGLRVAGGPAGSVIAQLPVRRTAYLAATLAF